MNVNEMKAYRVRLYKDQVAELLVSAEDEDDALSIAIASVRDDDFSETSGDYVNPEVCEVGQCEPDDVDDDLREARRMAKSGRSGRADAFRDEYPPETVVAVAIRTEVL